MARSSFSGLVELIARLRSPSDGCPWDRAQDHRSLRPYLLEEAYETIAAIDSGDPELLMDELGDILLQVLLHSQIASEAGRFTVVDVIANLSDKVVRRHPHVFADAADDRDSLRTRWNEIKEAEPRPKMTPPILIAARKAVSGLGSSDLKRNAEEPSDEESAGLTILAAIAKAWESGYDPEIALRKAIDRVTAAAPRSPR